MESGKRHKLSEEDVLKKTWQEFDYVLYQLQVKNYVTEMGWNNKGYHSSEAKGE